MIKPNKKTLFILLVIVFFVFGVKEVRAGVVINEVQIAPTSERFIELYNNSGSEVDLTGYYLQRKTNTSEKHTSFISNTKLSGKKIPANGLFLITKDSLGLETLTITESSSIQLKNSKQEVVYKIGLGESNDCGNICVSNPTDGNSVQRVDEDTWIVGNPTPGDNNLSSEQEDDEETESTSSDIPEEKEKVILNSSIVTKIISPKIVVAGVPFVINHKTIGYKNEEIIHDRFVWNFGDGNFKEMDPCLPFNYIYLYPGDYVLSLSYYETSFSEIPEVTDRLNIKVIPSGIKITSVGNIGDPYIELENSSSHEMVLNQWSIVGVGHTFTIPNGTIILPNKKIRFSPKITGFKIEDLLSLKIVDNNNTLFAVYPKSEATKNVELTTGVKNIKPKSNDNEDKKETTLDQKEEVVDLNSLSASAYKSDRINNRGILYVGLLLVIILGIMAVITIKRSNKNEDSGLEKELSAEDFKITE